MQEMLGVRSHGTDRYTSGRALEQTRARRLLKMTPNVQLCTPEDSNRAAAEAMAALDVGLLPAAENDRLVGMISDRDIATHRVVMGRKPLFGARAADLGLDGVDRLQPQVFPCSTAMTHAGYRR